MNDHVKRRKQRGFTLLEVTISAGFLVVAILGTGMAIQAGLSSTREMQERQLVRVRAQLHLNQVMSLNFGLRGDPQPTQAQLEELFNDDTDPGSATLMALTQAPAQDGAWTFRLGDFPVDGQWTVAVTQDLDRDGAVAGPLETGGVLVRITVSFGNEEILSTIRGKETHA